MAKPAANRRSESQSQWKFLEWVLIVVVAPGSSTGFSARAQSSNEAQPNKQMQVKTSSMANHSELHSSTLTTTVDESSSASTAAGVIPVLATISYQVPFYPAATRAGDHSLRPDSRHAATQATGGTRPAAGEVASQGMRPLYGPAPGQIAAGPGGNYGGAILIEASSSMDVLHLPVGRSVVLSTGVPLRRVYVGDAKVLQSFSSGPKEDVITSRSCGVSTLILWDTGGRRRMYTVYADLDTEGLSQAIAEALPDARVLVRAKADRVYLEGTVPSDAAADVLNRLATVYSKDVVNGVRIVPPRTKQIELKLRIVEVDRSRLAQYGINFFALGGSTLANSSTQQFSTAVTPATASTALTVSDPLNLLLYSAKLNAGVTIKDLEEKQVLQVLAEPTLTTMSGITARFLSGGEFPLPVVQGGTGNSTAITIVWKPYGVKVEFTPTANGDGSIRLKVAPEVSTLDYTNAVTISGFTVPALSTRRAETEVELQDGQSFVLSGLLDHRTSDSLSRMPGIASVPILGQLFRSKGVTLSTVDLVVIVTATVVDPLAHPVPVVEPGMIFPNLDKQRFDQDVTKKGHSKNTESSIPISAAAAERP
jgi:pilus assembly protein CpaC